MAEDDKPKRKQKSGAQKRREKRERDAAKLEQRNIGQQWLQQPAYRGIGDQFDENASPFELPAYGAAPAVMVKIIQSILIALEAGQMQAPSIMADGMMRDERVFAAMDTRLNGLFGEPLELEVADESDAALDAKEACDEVVAKIIPVPQAKEFMRRGLMLGVALGQRLTTRTLKSATPTLHTWNTRFMYYDWLLRRWHIITQNRGDVVIEPEDPEWILYEPYGPQGFMHGALLRCLAIPFAIRHWARTWWARQAEVNGMPIRIGIIPAQRDPRDEATFLSQLANLAHEAVIRLPQGTDGNKFDVKLLEANAKTWEGFKELLTHADDSIAIGILGQKQSTNGQGGLGTDENAGETTIMRLLRGDAQVGDVFREKLLCPWADENLGDPEIAPWPFWQIEQPEDLKLKSESLYKYAQAVALLAAVPADKQHVDLRGLAEDFELPLLDESDVPEETPGEPAPGTEPPGAEQKEPDGDEGQNPDKPSDSEGDENA